MLITQEHFDELVQENIQDFEMSLEEALKEAVEQVGNFSSPLLPSPSHY